MKVLYGADMAPGDSSTTTASTAAVCERCGAVLPARSSKGGRPRRWCSDECRDRAARQRRKGGAGAASVPGLVAEAAVPAVLASPAMTRMLLTDLAATIRRGDLDGSEFNHVISAVLDAHNAVVGRVISKNQPV